MKQTENTKSFWNLIKLTPVHYVLLVALVIIILSLLSVIKLELVINGLVMGSIIAMASMGLTLVYGNLKFAHMAHGDFMTLSAYIVLFILTVPFHYIGMRSTGLGPFTFGYPLLIAIPFVVLVTASIAIGLDRIIYRRLRNRGSNSVILAMCSLGVAIAGRGIVQTIWGGDIEQFPRLSKLYYQLPMDVRIPPDAIFIAGVVLISTFSLHLFLTRTKMGKAMRATADNTELAKVTGINTELVIRWTWALSGGFAAIAGVLLAVFQAQLLPSMGWSFLIPLFAAVILGGIGNPYGAVIGAMIVGISGEVSTQWINPTYKPVIAFAILIIMLLLRPQGILGTRD
jgi:branched-chain amino acid transport system permease protein/neutral amino acid transport system permease protein